MMRKVQKELKDNSRHPKNDYKLHWIFFLNWPRSTSTITVKWIHLHATDTAILKWHYFLLTLQVVYHTSMHEYDLTIVLTHG